MTKRIRPLEATRLLALLTAICLALATPFPALAAEEVGDSLNEEIQNDIDGGSEASDGADAPDKQCVGECSGADAGSSGAIGESRRGRSSGTQGEKTGPTAAPTSSSSGSRAASTSTSRTASRAGSSVRSTQDSSIPMILLYPETATPIPDPLPTSVQSLDEAAESTEAESETGAEQAAQPAQDPVRNTNSGGFPARRVLGILAVLVAVGSAWSLFMQDRRKPGRRSLGRRTPRRL